MASAPNLELVAKGPNYPSTSELVCSTSSILISVHQELILAAEMIKQKKKKKSGGNGFWRLMCTAVIGWQGGKKARCGIVQVSIFCSQQDDVLSEFFSSRDNCTAPKNETIQNRGVSCHTNFCLRYISWCIVFFWMSQLPLLHIEFTGIHSDQ